MATNSRILHVFLLAISLPVSLSQSNQVELKAKETNQEKVIRLGQPMQHKSTDPSKVIQLSWQPRVFVYRNFLSDEECDHLISQVHGKKSRTVLGNDSSKIDRSNILPHFNFSLDVDDEVTRRIEERISAWTFIPKDYSESFRVLHFGSENSKQKYNYFDTKFTKKHDQPLLATVILYLSDITQGGHIIFPHSSNKMLSECGKISNSLRPHKGNAVVFFNLRLNSSPDTSSSHARCPVSPGDNMWCATKFFYVKKVIPERDSSVIDIVDCMDEDENCPQWAAIGECRRNPIFMIGSPDYFGACRKSCNVCH